MLDDKIFAWGVLMICAALWGDRDKNARNISLLGAVVCATLHAFHL